MIVIRNCQARTDTQGIKQATLANRLQIDLNDRMTKADGISLLAKPTTVKLKLDFNGKTAIQPPMQTVIPLILRLKFLRSQQTFGRKFPKRTTIK